MIKSRNFGHNTTVIETDCRSVPLVDQTIDQLAYGCELWQYHQRNPVR